MSDLLTNTLLALFGLVGLLILGLAASVWLVLREFAWFNRRVTDLEVAETHRKVREQHCSGTRSP